MNGKVIKSFNQWFNKKRAKWMGFSEIRELLIGLNG